MAAAVSAGRADTDLGSLAARAFGLDFVPVAQEPNDLVLQPDSVTDDRLAPLWTLLDRGDSREEIEALGGCSCAETGVDVAPISPAWARTAGSAAPAARSPARIRRASWVAICRQRVICFAL